MGIAGRIAGRFLRSKLTPLVTLAAMAAGLMAILATPREEEPQISVPMIDVLVALPGATPTETENLLVRPIERRMFEIPGVEHVYSTAGDGFALVTVRFRVGRRPGPECGERSTPSCSPRWTRRPPAPRRRWSRPIPSTTCRSSR